MNARWAAPPRGRRRPAGRSPGPAATAVGRAGPRPGRGGSARPWLVLRDGAELRGGTRDLHRRTEAPRRGAGADRRGGPALQRLLLRDEHRAQLSSRHRVSYRGRRQEKCDMIGAEALRVLVAPRRSARPILRSGRGHRDEQSGPRRHAPREGEVSVAQQGRGEQLGAGGGADDREGPRRVFFCPRSTTRSWWPSSMGKSTIRSSWESVERKDTAPESNADGQNNHRTIKSRSGHVLRFNDKAGGKRSRSSTGPEATRSSSTARRTPSPSRRSRTSRSSPSPAS